MARPRSIPDSQIYAAIRQLLSRDGEKAASFGAVARATGLAAPTLVQRYGSQAGMIRAALLDAWDRLDAATSNAMTSADMSAKGAQALLKALADDAPDADGIALLASDFRDPALRDRAAAWRHRVEDALAIRLGGGGKGREVAAILFAAWQGQALWQAAGGKSFKMKDAVKRLT